MTTTNPTAEDRRLAARLHATRRELGLSVADLRRLWDETGGATPEEKAEALTDAMYALAIERLPGAGLEQTLAVGRSLLAPRRATEAHGA